MIFAHLPAGYIASTHLFRRLGSNGVGRLAFIWAGMLGAIAPDSDLLYYYLIDDEAHPHHTYLTHLPCTWICLTLLCLIALRFTRTRRWPVLALIFSINAFIHLMLDGISGQIWWLAPFVDHPFTLLPTPHHPAQGLLNLIAQKAFGLELLIMAWAFCLWRKRQPFPPRQNRLQWAPASLNARRK